MTWTDGEDEPWLWVAPLERTQKLVQVGPPVRIIHQHGHVVAGLDLGKVVRLEGQAIVNKEPGGGGATRTRKFERETRLSVATLCLYEALLHL